MGTSVSNLKGLFKTQVRFQKLKTIAIVVLGLDGVGKSTIISHVNGTDEQQNPEEDVYITPTVGMCMHRFKYLKLNWVVRDMAGAGRYRPMWSDFYRGTQGFIFVVDASNILRLGTTKAEFNQFVSHPDVQGTSTPILIFLSKTDHATDNGEKPVSKVALQALLDLRLLKHPKHIQMCNGLSGAGVAQGLQWLLDTCCAVNKKKQMGATG